MSNFIRIHQEILYTNFSMYAPPRTAAMVEIDNTPPRRDDVYIVVDSDPKATIAQIQDEYKELGIECYPDRFVGIPTSEGAYITTGNLLAANETLLDMLGKTNPIHTDSIEVVNAVASYVKDQLYVIRNFIRLCGSELPVAYTLVGDQGSDLVVPKGKVYNITHIKTKARLGLLIIYDTTYDVLAVHPAAVALVMEMFGDEDSITYGGNNKTIKRLTNTERD